jgi:predicted transcriptional regulator
MKVQKIKIQMKSLDQALDDFVDVATKIKAGKKVKPKKGTYIADVETARAIFTESRMTIIQLLKSKEPGSIYALAKLLKRDFKNVYDDVIFLNQLGILKIEESTTGRKRKKPILLCDKILFEMAS